jgi:hypothetical protein
MTANFDLHQSSVTNLTIRWQTEKLSAGLIEVKAGQEGLLQDQARTEDIRDRVLRMADLGFRQCRKRSSLQIGW